MGWPKLGSWFLPSWDWLQVEVTTNCNAAGIYCPRTLYRETWENRHLPLELFRRLLPALARIRLVHLQGWGEPFLHPEFFTMAALAKAQGCRVGVTTNGMLLDHALIQRLVETELDVVAFSLAGTGEANDRIRRGTRLEQVLAAMGALHEAKARSGRHKPDLHLAYLLLRSGLGELDHLPGLLAGKGVSQVVISTLDFVGSPELEREAWGAAPPAARLELRERLNVLAAQGRQLGLNIHPQIGLPAQGGPRCPENAGRAAVVSAAGEVFPCVFTNLPVTQAVYFHRGQAYPHQSRSFGNLEDRTLEEIWMEPAYVRFRRDLARGCPPAPCCRCYKLHDGSKLERGDRGS